MKDAGFGLVLITNQSGIARGLFDADTLGRVNARMEALLLAAGVHLDGIYWCPHGPDDGCRCRKPRTGLVTAAAKAHGFNPAESIVVGDDAADIELGRNLGAMTILVLTGHGASVLEENRVRPDHTVADLGAAADLILRLGGW